MDPNACLARIRILQTLIESGPQDPDSMHYHANELSEAMQDMDEWLSKGGFLPDAWDSKKGLAQLLQPIDTEVQCGTAALDEALDGEHFGGLR